MTLQVYKPCETGSKCPEDAMMFLKMKRNLKLKGKRKNERKINMNSSGKRKVNWTPQISMELLRCMEQTDKRAAECYVSEMERDGL